MKKIFKLLLLSVFILNVAFSMFACGTNEGGNTSESTSRESGSGSTSEPTSDSTPDIVYPTDDKQFLLGSWVSYYDTGIKSLDEQMKALHEAGLNYTIAPYPWAVRNSNSDVYDTVEDWLEIDRLCQKYGMYYYASTPKGQRTQEGFEEVIGFGDALKNSPYFSGYWLWDEPSYDKLPEMAAWYKKYLTEDKLHKCFVNLAGGSGVAGVDFRAHCQKYVDVIGKENVLMLSYDCYPFRTGATADSMTLLDDVKFMCSEVVRDVAYKNGKLRTHSFPQSTGFTGAIMPDYDQIAWDDWGYIAYGFKALTYFNYVCPGESAEEGERFIGSFIDRDGTIIDQNLYDNVTALNYRMRAVGDVLIGYDAVHAYHCVKGKYGNYVEYLPSGYFVSPATTNHDWVISAFEPKNEDDDIIFTVWNNDLNNSNTETFNLDMYSGVETLEKFNDTTKEWEEIGIDDYKFELTLGIGEFAMFRVTGVSPSSAF